LNPSEKWWSSSDRIIIPLGKLSQPCSKPPTSYCFYHIKREKFSVTRQESTPFGCLEEALVMLQVPPPALRS
jgi:hypothetical protein